MKGRRVVWPEDRIPIEQEKFMGPGDYAGPWRGMWLLCAPNGDWGSVGNKHQVTEHPDGTVTIYPSVQFETGHRWHGFLEKGIWQLAN